MAAGFWKRDKRTGGLRFGDEIFEELRIDKREVHSQNQIPVIDGVGESGVDSTQRSATGINVRDDGTECREFIRISDYLHVFGNSLGEDEGTHQQQLAGEFQESFVGAHAGTLAAGEDEGRDGFHIAIIQRRLRMQVSPSEVLAARAAHTSYTKVTYRISEFRWMMNLPTLAR